MIRNNRWVVLLLLAMGPWGAHAQFYDQHEKLRTATNVHDVGGDKSQKLVIEKRQAQCMAVVAIAKFCDCIARELPAGLSFDQYVVVLTRPKKDNGYDGLDRAGKKVYDSIPVIRDKCSVDSTASP